MPVTVPSFRARYTAQPPSDTPPAFSRYTCNYPANCRGGLHYPGRCFEGQDAIYNCSVDLCSTTSGGALCGKCKWSESPRSYMKSERCFRCKGGETTLVISVFVLFIIVPVGLALALTRFANARALTYVYHNKSGARH